MLESDSFENGVHDEKRIPHLQHDSVSECRSLKTDDGTIRLATLKEPATALETLYRDTTA